MAQAPFATTPNEDYGGFGRDFQWKAEGGGGCPWLMLPPDRRALPEDRRMRGRAVLPVRLSRLALHRAHPQNAG